MTKLKATWIVGIIIGVFIETLVIRVLNPWYPVILILLFTFVTVFIYNLFFKGKNKPLIIISLLSLIIGMWCGFWLLDLLQFINDLSFSGG